MLESVRTEGSEEDSSRISRSARIFASRSIWASEADLDDVALHPKPDGPVCVQREEEIHSLVEGQAKQPEEWRLDRGQRDLAGKKQCPKEEPHWRGSRRRPNTYLFLSPPGEAEFLERREVMTRDILARRSRPGSNLGVSL